MPPGMIPDDDASYYDDDGLEGLAPIEESEDSYDSSAATKGSDDPFSAMGVGRLGMNDAAAHSTIVIKPPLHPRNGRASADEALAASSDDEEAEAVGGLGAPPAYDTPDAGSPAQQQQPDIGSRNSNSPPPSPTTGRRRSTRAERTTTSGRGTALRPGDIGNGVDTIRPVKRVDTAGSLKLSAEYVGAVREGLEGGTRGSAGSGNSGEGKDGKDGKESKESKENRRRASENAKAGRTMMDEVVVPAVQNVRPQFCFLSPQTQS